MSTATQAVKIPEGLQARMEDTIRATHEAFMISIRHIGSMREDEIMMLANAACVCALQYREDVGQ